MLIGRAGRRTDIGRGERTKSGIGFGNVFLDTGIGYPPALSQPERTSLARSGRHLVYRMHSF